MIPTQTINIFDRLGSVVLSIPFLRWFFQKGYAQGVFWAIMICVTSSTNDVLMCHLGNRLHTIEISFFRFLFSMLSVLPFMLMQGGTKHFYTEQPKMHVWRAVVGAIALGLTCYSVHIMPLSENTSIMFTEPLFFLPLAFFFLRERVGKSRWFATMLGFFGLLIIMQPGSNTFQIAAFIPLTAAFLFATLNVMAKKMLKEESSYTLLFYFGVGTTIISFFPLLFFWTMPTLSELFLLLLLGVGGNMIQVCLFRALSATDGSAIMPFRYFEFIVASIFGFIFFGQIPTLLLVMGTAIIVISTLYITYIETKKEKLAV